MPNFGRALVGARLATLGCGRPPENAEISVIRQAAAAKLFNGSPDSIQFARTVLDQGTPELVMAVEQGRLAVSTAVQLTALAPGKQRDLMAALHTDRCAATNAAREVSRRERQLAETVRQPRSHDRSRSRVRA